MFFIPVARDELLPALQSGKGDIAATNLTVTADRVELVDFSAPAYPDVSEVPISGPALPAVAGIDDLAGKTVYVHLSPSHRDSLEALNQRFAAQGRAGCRFAERRPRSTTKT